MLPRCSNQRRRSQARQAPSVCLTGERSFSSFRAQTCERGLLFRQPRKFHVTLKASFAAELQLSMHAPLELQMGHSEEVQSALLMHGPHALVDGSQRGVACGHSVFRVHWTHSPLAALQMSLPADVQSVFRVHWTQIPRVSQIGVASGQRIPVKHVSRPASTGEAPPLARGIAPPVAGTARPPAERLPPSSE